MHCVNRKARHIVRGCGSFRLISVLLAIVSSWPLLAAHDHHDPQN